MQWLEGFSVNVPEMAREGLLVGRASVNPSVTSSSARWMPNSTLPIFRPTSGIFTKQYPSVESDGSDEANLRRILWSQEIHAQNTAALLDLLKKHRDFGSAVCDIAYELYLSDRQILDDMEQKLLCCLLPCARRFCR